MKTLFKISAVALTVWAASGCTRTVVERPVERERIIEHDRGPEVIEHREIIERR